MYIICSNNAYTSGKTYMLLSCCFFFATESSYKIKILVLEEILQFLATSWEKMVCVLLILCHTRLIKKMKMEVKECLDYRLEPLKEDPSPCHDLTNYYPSVFRKCICKCPIIPDLLLLQINEF